MLQDARLALPDVVEIDGHHAQQLPVPDRRHLWILHAGRQQRLRTIDEPGVDLALGDGRRPARRSSASVRRAGWMIASFLAKASACGLEVFDGLSRDETEPAARRTVTATRRREKLIFGVPRSRHS